MAKPTPSPSIESINVEPDWSVLFEYCINIVRAELPADRGQATVVEMLKFGSRLQVLIEKLKVRIAEMEPATERLVQLAGKDYRSSEG
jgi:hypothetical protein